MRGAAARGPVPLEAFGAQVADGPGRRRGAGRAMKLRALPRCAVACCVVAAAVVPAVGYLKLGTRVGDAHRVRSSGSDFPIRYFVTDRGVTGVTAQQFQTAVSGRSQTWDAVETAETSSQFAGFTQANPIVGRRRHRARLQNRPDLDRTLGATNFIVDTTTGEILESDIFFNTSFPWSTARRQVTGPPRRRVDRAARDRAPASGSGTRRSGETELIAGGRRVLGAEAVMFPDRVSPPAASATAR